MGLGVGLGGLGDGLGGLGDGLGGLGVGVNGLGVGVTGLGVGLAGLDLGLSGGGVGLEFRIGAGVCSLKGVTGKDGTAGVTCKNEGDAGAMVVGANLVGVGVADLGGFVGIGGNLGAGVVMVGLNCGLAFLGIFTDSISSSPECLNKSGLGLNGGKGVNG